MLSFSFTVSMTPMLLVIRVYALVLVEVFFSVVVR